MRRPVERERQRKQRDERRRNFQCVMCGDKIPLVDRGKYTNCIKCRRKRRPITAGTNKRMYNKAKKSGKCVVCKKRKVMVDPETKKPMSMCGFCTERREEYRETTASFYEGTGLCPCGNERKDKTKKYCETCRKSGSKRSSKSWKRLKGVIEEHPLVPVVSE